jgi:hypothetical protein
MAFLGFDRFARADRIYALEPLRGTSEVVVFEIDGPIVDQRHMVWSRRGARLASDVIAAFDDPGPPWEARPTPTSMCRWWLGSSSRPSLPSSRLLTPATLPPVPRR